VYRVRLSSSSSVLSVRVYLVEVNSNPSLPILAEICPSNQHSAQSQVPRKSAMETYGCEGSVDYA
jgi:hypothetical protein